MNDGDDKWLKKQWDRKRALVAASKEAGEVRVWTKGTRICVSAPLNARFKTLAMELGGKWRPRSGGIWSFPLARRRFVIRLVERCYSPDWIDGNREKL